MKRVLFLSGADLMGQISDDDYALPALEDCGIEIETRTWQEPIEWELYDAAVIRSTWDYFHQPEAFLERLKTATCPLFNGVEAVEWNLRKDYLKRLPVAVIPTHYHPSPQPALLADYLGRYGELVVKPVVAAGGFDTYRLTREGTVPKLKPGDWMVQPLVPSIRELGELSLIYFDGRFSHAVRKTPAEGEFRIQLIHGGRVEPVVDPPAEALKLGSKVLAELPWRLLYSRVDLVLYQGVYVLMELELIEPSLYFDQNPESRALFAETLLGFLN